MYLFLTLSILTAGCASKLPVDFKRCSSKDTTCLKSAIEDALPMIKNGIPELGVPALDPISSDELVIPAGPHVVRFVQRYKDVNFYGFSTAKIANAILDLEAKKLNIDFTVPLLELNATFNFEGEALTLPIRGSGESAIQLFEAVSSFQTELDIFNKGNDKYIKGRQPKLKIDVDHCKYILHNSDEKKIEIWNKMNIVMNENWKSIYDEVIQDYTAAYAIRLSDLMNKILENIPISELFIDK